MARPGRLGLLRRPAPGQSGPRGGVFQFFGEVVNELKKVTWPTRQETTRLTILVVAVAVSIGIALGVADLILTRILNIIISLGETTAP